MTEKLGDLIVGLVSAIAVCESDAQKRNRDINYGDVRDVLARILGPVLAEHAKRTQDLLEANNRYLERARHAERRLIAELSRPAPADADPVLKHIYQIRKRVREGEVDLRDAAGVLGLPFDQDVLAEILRRAAWFNASIQTSPIIDRLRQRADEMPILLSCPPKPHADAVLMREAADTIADLNHRCLAIAEQQAAATSGAGEIDVACVQVTGFDGRYRCQHCTGTGRPHGIMGGPEHGVCGYCMGSGVSQPPARKS